MARVAGPIALARIVLYASHVPRYITRARGFVETPLFDDQREGGRPEISVDGAKETDTGLFDRFGNMIMRLQDPIGFGRD